MSTTTAALPPHRRRPDLEVDQILAWADAHHQRTGDWPTADSGFVRAAGQEKWTNIDAALRKGLRSLSPGSSLARQLALHRGVRNRKELPALDRDRILEWADAYHARTGQWPQRGSGPIPEAPGETWMAVEAALAHGLRGLPAGSSLAQVLARFRGVRHQGATPLLSEAQVLTWADAHHVRTGRWPTAECGPVEEAEGETWMAVNEALKRGYRGLPGGASLANFLEERRGVPNRLHQPDLTVDQILRWADAHHARTGRWPTRASGPVHDAPGQTWSALSACLTNGNRGLPGGSSLARLLAEERGAAGVGPIAPAEAPLGAPPPPRGFRSAPTAGPARRPNSSGPATTRRAPPSQRRASAPPIRILPAIGPRATHTRPAKQRTRIPNSMKARRLPPPAPESTKVDLAPLLP